MATLADLEELALALPETARVVRADGRFDVQVRTKTFCRQREPRPDAIDEETGERMDDVLLIRTESIEARDVLRADPRGAWFITDHFANYPAILVRERDLHLLTRDDLDDALVEAWLAYAPKRLAKAWLAEQGAES